MNQQGFDYNKLRIEAQIRWLKPAEVLYILQDHERYPITPEAPQQPPSGSLFLFNRRVLRYFRKDGHNWRKKKDGRNVGEAHERLKVGNVDAINCYYAHGQQNPYFQRRSYWMLDPAYEHIVLVHYREVSEGRNLPPSNSNMSADSCSTFIQSTSSSISHRQGIASGTSEQYDPNGCICSPATVEEVSSKFAVGKSDLDHLHKIDGLRNSGLLPQPEVSLALRKLAIQLSLEDDGDKTVYFGEKLPAFSSEYEKSEDFAVLDQKTRDSLQEAHENVFHGAEYWKNNQMEHGKQDGYSSLQSFKIAGEYGKQGIQSLSSGYNIGTTQSPWNHMLEFDSGSAQMNACGITSNLSASAGGVDFFIYAPERPSNLSAPPGILESSISRPCGITSNLSASAGGVDSFIYAPERPSNLSAPPGILESSISRPCAHDQMLHSTLEKSYQFTWPQLDHRGANAENRSIGHHIPGNDQLSATSEFLLDPENSIESPISVSQLSKVQSQDTSGTSICETNSDMAKFRKQNSTDWMTVIDLDVPNNTHPSDFSGMFFDQAQFGVPLRDDSSLTVAEKQRFSIREISPEWSYSFESTKVIVTGDFLCDSSECTWAIKFGDIQVRAEIVQEGVLRCMTPQHGDGKVTLCVTSGNRESCSEVREFEFQAKPTISSLIGTFHNADSTSNPEELLLLVRLVHMLLSGSEDLSTLKIGMGTESTLKAEGRWSQITEALLVGSQVPSDTLDCIIQELLKDKLQQWLSSKHYKDCPLSKQEQGIVHMVSGLGYGWALNLILDSGVGVNFRDANGWTALHWAARFEREEMVAALLAAGASAGAVTDPTPIDPVGKTAGAIASAYGHKGLAGYLSEVDLTSHLSSLTMGEIEISKGSAEVEAERAVESISQRSVQIHLGGTEDELSLKDSLAAVRNATQAAARIQAAFRAHSFRRQQIAATSQDEYGMTPEDVYGLSILSKYQRALHVSRDLKFDKAALSIQKKYRGWKGHKDFLTLRQHVVKIQAHFRGYQERKRYKEFVWTVGVLEKAVLRWRRKGVGLRGYRAEPELIDEGDEEVENIVKIFRKQKVDAAVDQAVSRVLSIVDSPTSRQQYRRMLERYHQAKAELCASDEAASTLTDDSETTESNNFMY